jgi:hypothetical protein
MDVGAVHLPMTMAMTFDLCGLHLAPFDISYRFANRMEDLRLGDEEY